MRRAASFSGLRMGGFAALGAVWLFSGSTPGYARITSITYTTSQPYGTVSFGSVGQYQELDGIATGTLDPRDPLNAIITDLGLAPQVNRAVPYSLTFSILMPVDLSKSNRTLLYDIVNRGNKVITNWNNVLPASPTPPAYGDGFLEEQGFIIAWSGWEVDLIQAPTTPTITRIQLLDTPVAVNRNGSAITGRVAEEYDLNAATTVVPLGSNPMVGNNGAAYPPVTLDNSNATLTARVLPDDPKVPIPNSQWSFAPCTTAQFPTVVNITSQICVNMPAGFDTNHIYELTYRGDQEQTGNNLFAHSSVAMLSTRIEFRSPHSSDQQRTGVNRFVPDPKHVSTSYTGRHKMTH